MLNTREWKPFFLKDICHISMGNKLDYINMTYEQPILNFIGRSAENNGVVGRVDKIPGIEPYHGGCLTVALGGSIGCTYLQPDDFYTSQNVSVLQFDDMVSDKAKLFLSTLIMNECKYKYIAFGRELNIHIRTDFSLLLPSVSDKTGKIEPDWKWMESFVSSIYKQPLKSNVKYINVDLSLQDWGEFRIGDLFLLQRGTCHNAENLVDGNDIFYVGAKKNDNGIMRKVAYDKNMVVDGNCIIFICNGEGSGGYTLYQDSKFIPSGDLVLGRNEHLNQYIGMFLVTIFEKERYKYSFGRKWGRYLADTHVKLPAKKDARGNQIPDCKWMESYIKSLCYSDQISRL